MTSPRTLRITTDSVSVRDLALGIAAATAVSFAYGLLLVLPLRVTNLGGDEKDFGLVLSAALLPALIVLVALTMRPTIARASRLLAAAIAVLGVGALAASVVDSDWRPLIGVGVLVGTAWAVVYTVAPMVVSNMVTDEARVKTLGWLTGAEQIGIGLGPVVAKALIDGLGFTGVFAVGAVVCALGAGLSLLVREPIPEPSPSRGAVRDLAADTRLLARSRPAAWLLIIALFASLFTTMTQFQATFARSRDLDYSYFFIAYTVAVIAARFLISPWAARFAPSIVMLVSCTVVTASCGSFLLIGSSPVAYAAVSAALGAGYGVALPTAQGVAVNDAPEALRARVLPLAGLVFQGAILGFPLIVGYVVAAGGYGVLLALLAAIALAQTGVSARQALAARS